MKKDGLIIYGRNPVNELAATHPKLIQQLWVADSIDRAIFDEVRTMAKHLKIPFAGVGEKYLKQMLGNDTVHQGIAARLREFPYTEWADWLSGIDIAEKPSVVLLDELQDPHNVGAIIRTAAAMGVSAVLMPTHRQVGVTSSVIKTSVGAAFHIPVIKIGNVNQTLATLKEAGFWIAGLDIDVANQDLQNAEFDSPMVFVIGNEGEGIRLKTKEACDYLFQIPMQSSVESLNASVSAGMVLYEWRRQQR